MGAHEGDDAAARIGRGLERLAVQDDAGARALDSDLVAALEADSKRVGTQGANIDFALLVDGLSAERVARKVEALLGSTG